MTNVMKEGLRRNACNLDSYTYLSQVEDLPLHRKACIGDALRYACCFWTTHLARASPSRLNVEEIQNEINGFFTTHLLFGLRSSASWETLMLGFVL